MVEKKEKNNFINESGLIALCAQRNVLPHQRAKILALLENDLDWEYIIKVAGRNGVLPLVSAMLLKNYETELPVAVKNELKQRFQIHTQRNLFLTFKLSEIIRLLTDAGIPSLPFKGPVLAQVAYENLSLRQYCDLDILVQPKHFDAATKILLENKYQTLTEANWLKRKALFFSNEKDISLISEDKQVHIELHWKLSGTHFSMPVEMSELWDRFERINLGQTPVNSLSFNDLFVYLCLHGARHEWERLAWICDLRELILTKQKQKPIDWTQLFSHAREYGCEKVVELGIFLIDSLFETDLDFPELAKVSVNHEFAEIAKAVRERMFAAEPNRSLKHEKYAYLLSLREDKLNRLKLYLVYLTFYLRIVFTPNSLDKSIFPLPAIFSPLYFVLRPFRLTMTYLNRDLLKKLMLKNK